MPVQAATDYQTSHGAAIAGAVVDGQLKNIVSRVAEEDIPFGRFVVHGTADNEVALVTAGDIAGGLGVGFSVRVQEDVADASDVLEVKTGKDANVLDFGEIWVETLDAVAAYEPVFVHVLADADQGKVRNDAAGGDAEALGGARFMSSTSGAGLARVAYRRSL
jgi:hypothetical protein